MADLGAGEVHVVLPLRRDEDQAQVAGLVAQDVVVQMAQAHDAQHPVQLVDRHHRGGRVVDRRRQGLDGDVDQDAQGEGRVLLHRALGAERDRGTQPLVVDGDGAAVQAKQRLVDREEVADLRHELDVAVGLAGQRHQARQVDGEHHPRRALVQHDPAGHGMPDRAARSGPDRASVPCRRSGSRGCRSRRRAAPGSPGAAGGRRSR